MNNNLAIANRSHVSCAQYAEGIYRHKLILHRDLEI